METIKDIIIIGNAFLQNWRGPAPNLESIRWVADFRDWEGSAPKLKSIGRWAYFQNWLGSAPKLKSINKKPFIWRGDL
jgi:hypothetical protein